MIPETPSRPRILEAQQVKHLFHAVQGQELEAFVSLALVTGLRPVEMATLTWNQFDLEQGTVATPRKAGGCTTLYLPRCVCQRLAVQKERCRAATEARLCCDTNGFPLSLPRIRPRFLQVLEQEQLPPIRLFGLRESAISIMVQQFAAPIEVVAFLADVTLRSRQVHLSFSIEETQHAIASQWDTFLMEASSPR